MPTLNSHCQLPTETINVKLPPVTAARLEVFEEVPSTHFLPTSKLPELPEAPNRKKLRSVELKLAPYKDS